MNHATPNDDDANDGCLPGDVLANVFLRLPARDLRRLRRVRKEWHGVISDPVFVNEHMNHGPWGLTHTIVFLRGCSSGPDPHDGHGFLFDEQWRLVATFTAGESEEMVGTCNGLLCFLDVHQGAIIIVEPFNGESLAVPLPPKSERSHERGAYCFGFDPSSRRYKIVHQRLDDFHTGDDTATKEQHLLQVYTIGGGGENCWRTLQVDAGAVEPGVSYKDPVLVDGSLYWPVETTGQLVKLVRFDLATEEITAVSTMDFLLPVDDDECPTAFHLMADSDPDSNAWLCVVTVGPFGECGVFSLGEGGRWTPNSCCGGGVELPDLRRLALPQALQRGHLLLEQADASEDRKRVAGMGEGGMYVHPIPPPTSSSGDLGSGKPLLKIDNKEKDKELAAKSNTRGLFVPALSNQEAGRLPRELTGATTTTTFCYAPPVSPAPLAHRCGFPCGLPPQTLAENKLASY